MRFIAQTLDAQRLDTRLDDTDAVAQLGQLVAEFARQADAAGNGVGRQLLDLAVDFLLAFLLLGVFLFEAVEFEIENTELFRRFLVAPG